LEIGLVLLGESWEVDIGIWKVDTLLGGNLAIVSATNADSLVINDIENVKSKDTIVNVDDSAWSNNLGNVLIVDIPR